MLSGVRGIIRTAARHFKLDQRHIVPATLFRHLSTTPIMAKNPWTDAEEVKIVEDMFRLMVDEALVKGSSTDTPVVEFQHPAQLQKLLSLHIDEDGESVEEMKKVCRQVIKYSVKTADPRFYNQLYAGLEPFALLGGVLMSVLNTNAHTFEVAPCFVLIEKYIIQKIGDIVGFKNGDGVFGPGGSFNNIHALHLARFSRYPETKTEGLYGSKPLRFYTSDEAHYSLLKGASFLGFGTNNLVKIKTDARGKMVVSDLEAKVKEDIAAGSLPLFVMATSGSTVLGSYDSISDIAAVCRRYNLWLHVDGSWGAGALLSDKYRHLMEGVDLADSVAWNLHKTSGALIQCSVLAVKEQGLLQRCNRAQAEYLFQPDKFYDTSFDTGDKTVQCGRLPESVKLWFQWKAEGDLGIRSRIERAWDNAEYLAKQLSQTEGFRLVIPEFECTNVCFWYIPPCLRGQEETEDWWRRLGKVAPLIKQHMVEEGTMMIGYQPLSCKGLVNFFRVIVVNPVIDHAAMDKLIQDVDRLGRSITLEKLN